MIKSAIAGEDRTPEAGGCCSSTKTWLLPATARPSSGWLAMKWPGPTAEEGLRSPRLNPDIILLDFQTSMRTPTPASSHQQRRKAEGSPSSSAARQVIEKMDPKTATWKNSFPNRSNFVELLGNLQNSLQMIGPGISQKPEGR